MPIWNAITGRRRRVPTKYTYRKKRAGSLDHNAVATLKQFRVARTECVTAAASAMNLYLRAGVGRLVAFGAGDHLRQQFLGGMMHNILVTSVIPSYYFYNLFQTFDQMVADIPAAEEAAPTYRRAPRYRQIANFLDDNEARQLTNFDKGELVQLRDHFAFPPIVICGTYHLHQEEILLYGLIKLKGGYKITQMADVVVHDCDPWVSAAYHCFLEHLDVKYFDLIGPRGLERWGEYLGDFAEIIRKRVVKGRLWHDSPTNTTTENLGVWFRPENFAIFGIMDCKDWQISRPGSGPLHELYTSDLIGTVRRPNWYPKQRSVFSGHKHQHGVKTVSVGLPNGLTACVYGPSSSRRHDLQILEWSEIGRILYLFQTQFLGLGLHELYCLYGDSAYGVGARYSCIKKRHEPAPHMPLNARERAENSVMNSIREPIEWLYRDVAKLWTEAQNWYNRKLDLDAPTALATVRVMHLLTNCYNCIHGSSTASFFECAPPSLAEYLNIN